MKLLILGATGPTGRLVVEEALRAGDTCTAFVRNPTALGELAARVTVATGDATSAPDVVAVMPGHDAVISALGQGRSLTSGGLFARAAAAVIAAAKQSDVSRLVWMSSFGVGDTLRSASINQKLMYRTMLRWVYADKAVADEQIRASGLAWTIVYPTALTNGPARHTYKVDERIAMKGARRISRADVAAFMVDAAHGTEWVERDAVITD
jgi:putative NADH-flavin reductase